MNKKTMTLSKLAGLLALALFLMTGFASSGAFATANLMKEAKKQFGAEVKNCTYCHSAAMPKKDNVDLNDRGKWLVEQKKKRKADKIDVSWLADYKK